MPRPPRLDFPGALHHVWARGLDKRDVFFDDDDREAYVAAADDVFGRSGARCVAWCLMTNHVHLGIESGETHLSEVVHAIHTRYAKHFNLRYRRTGPVFQGRFGSSLREDGAVDELVAYVHLNPVGTPLAPAYADLDAYPWSGHRELTGTAPPRLIDPESVLSHFDPAPAGARAAMDACLQAFLGRDGASPAQRALRPVPLTRRNQIDVRTYGVAEVRARADYLEGAAATLRSRQLRRDAWQQRGGTPERLIAAVCRAVGAAIEAVRAGRRTPPEATARALAAHLACDELGLAPTDVARLTGVSRQAMSAARDRGRDVAVQRGIEIDAVLAAATVGGGATVEEVA